MKNTYPTHPDELTSHWLTQALGFEVAGFDVSYFSEGAGVMAWVTRVTLHGDPALPQSIIAKFPSPAQANRDVAAMFSMYEREVRFYQNIAADLSVRVPKCYHAEIDTNTQDFVLLMEDLHDLTIGDQVAGCRLPDAVAVVTTLAQFHASTWQPTKYPELISHNNSAQCEGMKASFAAGWPVVLEQFGDQIPIARRSVAALMPQVVASAVR